MPWEISPVGTKINAFVHEVNLHQRRLSITTFPPETWAKSVPPPRSRTSNNKNDEEVIDGNGSALSRIMALDLDDDADDEEDDEEEGVKVSVTDLSTSEIRALEQKRARVVLDDLNASSKPEDWSAGLNSKKDTTRGSSNEGDDLTSTELFNLISNGRPTITLKDLKCWDYLEELLDSGVIDEGQIKELLKINGEAGRLNEEQFDGFLDMLIDGLGFENEDLDEGLVDEELTSVSQIVQDEDEVGEEKEEMELTSRPEKDLAELSMSKPKTSDLFNYVFPNIFEVAPHMIQSFFDAMDAFRVSLGAGRILPYIIPGLFHPARRVREAYWRVYNHLYVGAQHALVPAFPVFEDEGEYTYRMTELELVL
jgi:hypothetical protein